MKIGSVVALAGLVALVVSVILLFEKKGSPVYQTCVTASAIVFAAGIISRGK